MNSYRRYFNRLNNPVFITAVTKNRQHLLMENIELLREAFKVSIKKFSYNYQYRKYGRYSFYNKRNKI